jgi:hypothetical protein
MLVRSIPVWLATLCALGGLAGRSWAGESAAAGDDPKEIVRRALRMDTRNRELERSYTYVRRDEERQLDGAGAVKHRESTTWEVVPLPGSQFRRLLQRNDQPLSPKDERAQEAARQKREALRQKAAERRAYETPAERQKRLDTRERARKQREQEADEVAEGFDLRLIGEEQIDGAPAWVIEGSPKKGYRFKAGQMARVLSKMKGRIWIATSDYQPVRIDAETTGTISFGGIIARIYKGTRVHVEYTHVNGEVWLPKLESFSGAGRIMLVKGLHMDGESAYSNYKKFSADSRIVDDQ